MFRRAANAIALGVAPLPGTGRIAILDPPDAPVGLDIPAERLEVISPMAQVHDACRAAGISARRAARGPYDAALLFLPRARRYARARLAEAVAIVPPGAPVLVDGPKTDGIETLLRDCRDRVDVRDSYVKSHGRLFWFPAAPGLEGWAIGPEDWPEVDGLRTAPGVFSADGIDPGSALLARHLPPLAGEGADLGAGWGFLSVAALRDGAAVRRLHLVDNDARALDAAAINLPDPRAVMHWADALQWKASAPLDFVLCNPPFHSGRAAEPDLGRAFIDAASRLLTRQGTLWLVANRHLPYEGTLSDRFRSVQPVVAEQGYKVIRADGARQVAQAGRPR